MRLVIKNNEDPSKFNSLEMVNFMISSRILNLIEQKPCTSIVHAEIAQVIWKFCKTLYNRQRTHNFSLEG